MALSLNGKSPRTNGRATPGRRTRGIRLTRSGLIGVLTTALLWYGSLLIDSNLLLLLVGMFLGVLFASLRLAIGALDGIEVHRVVPDTVSAGGPFTTRFDLRNTRRKRAFAIWVRQPLPDGSRAHALR